MEVCVKPGHVFLEGVFYPTTLDSTSLAVPKKKCHVSPVFREVSVLLLGFSLCDLLSKNLNRSGNVDSSN